MKKIFGLFIAIVLMLAGCGGGGGNTSSGSSSGGAGSGATVSGLALAGAPIIGYVMLKDSAGVTKGPSAIASDGSFSFDVDGLTPPFFLRAEGNVGGQGYDLYSVATGEGKANINPLTNVIVANTTGSDPAAVFTDPATHKNAVNDAALAQAVTDLQTFLQPLLAAHNATDVNPLTGAFAADHTGIDAVLDIVKVEVSNTGTVTVTDKTTNQVVAEAPADALAAPTDPLQTGEFAPAAVVTDIQAIAAVLADLATALNDPNRSYSSLSPFFATDLVYGIDNGMTRDQVINDWLMGVPDNITSITNLAIEFSGSDYNVYCTVFFADGSSERIDFFIMTNEGGSWKFKGNGYKTQLEFQVETLKSTKSSGTVVYESGFQLFLDDAGNNGIETTVVTGPGLPAGGVVLVKDANEPTRLLPQTPNSNIWNGFWKMTDSEIDAISDNSVYTIVSKDALNNVIETRTWKVQKRPYKQTEITDAIFPTFGGITSHAIGAANFPGTLSFTYAKPTAYTPVSMEAGMSGWGGTWGVDWGNSWVYKALNIGGTSEGLVNGTPPFSPVQGASFQLRAWDIYGRRTGQWWWFGN